MVLSAKLELRQGQTLVMTPQLQQAIKLLQLSNLELNAYVESELERNPLLEKEEFDGDFDSLAALGPNETKDPEAPAPEVQEADDWLANRTQDSLADRTNEGLDTGVENVFPETRHIHEANGVQPGDTSWSSIKSKGGVSEDVNLESYVAEEKTLQDHLTEQAQLAFSEPAQRLIASHLIDMVDESGYLRGEIETVKQRLGTPNGYVEDVLAVLQTFDPPGVFARSLAECLALQLKDRNRYDPLIASILDNLHLLAAHDFAALKKECQLDHDDLTDAIAEIKALDPKPGLKFGTINVQPVIPDVIVRKRADGAWHVELNSETLPKVLVNQHYYSTVSKTAKTKKDKNYLGDCLQTANWLVKSLDQRARTILKVAEEIIRQQDAFLTYGVQHLRPLNLKTVAEAISMHESTVSRVTANKYLATSRGIFELKYFFTSAISSAGAGEAHSSESVRFRIRQLIDNENPKKILSDDKIVELLQADGVEIARRTVAKYREAMRIPSSVQRRREKKIELAVTGTSA